MDRKTLVRALAAHAQIINYNNQPEFMKHGISFDEVLREAESYAQFIDDFIGQEGMAAPHSPQGADGSSF